MDAVVIDEAALAVVGSARALNALAAGAARLRRQHRRRRHEGLDTLAASSCPLQRRHGHCSLLRRWRRRYPFRDPPRHGDPRQHDARRAHGSTPDLPRQLVAWLNAGLTPVLKPVGSTGVGDIGLMGQVGAALAGGEAMLAEDRLPAPSHSRAGQAFRDHQGQPGALSSNAAGVALAAWPSAGP